MRVEFDSERITVEEIALRVDEDRLRRLLATATEVITRGLLLSS